MPNVTRRSFLKSASLFSAATVAAPYIMRGQQGQSPNNKLNVVCVGVGGRGRAAVEGVQDENIIAICDVDERKASYFRQAHPQVPVYHDFRKMFDDLGGKIDAVTVSTPDHMHFPIAMAALHLGKHVFVEKPLTHTIAEARQLAKVAREKKVATQMGNQGHAGDGARVLKEWVQAGVLGEVREVHCWTDRPIWPQGVELPDHSQFIPVIPKELSWDLWLGIAPPREYDPAYVPFKWRGYWDYGTGALGDMGCHVMDGAFWALDLDAPARVEAISARQTEVSGPTASVITYHFPARGAMPPVKLTWYDGGLMPLRPPELEAGRKLHETGSLIVGSKATVLCGTYYETVRIIPEAKMQALAPTLPPHTIPRIEGGHFAEWIRACKGGTPAGSRFDYSSRLTETVLLGNVAVRAQQPIEWDSAAMKITNLPEANQYLSETFREGFGV